MPIELCVAAMKRRYSRRELRVLVGIAILAVSKAVDKAALPCGELIIDEQGRRLLPIIVHLNLAAK